MDGASQADGRRVVSNEAAYWVVRLANGGGTQEEREAFEAWRNADPRNEASYEREAATWEALDRLRALNRGNTRIDPDLLVAHRQSKPWFEPRRAAAILAVVALGGGLLGAAGVASLATPAFATAVGERRIIALSDGSRIELNTDTKVNVRFGRKGRMVRLLRGEALFSVARGERPFTVEAAGRTIAAAPGELAVRIRPQRVEVIIRSGAAELTDMDTAVALRVAAGERALYGAGAPRLEQLTPARLDEALAWRHGEVAFNGESLSEAAAEINRYNTAQVVVSDPAIASLRLAGLFQSNDRNGFVQAVTRTFPVRAQRGEDQTIELVRAR